MISVNAIAVQISRDLALKEAAVRDKGIELANLEAQITRVQDEVEAVQAQCKAACHVAMQERQASEAVALRVKQDLAQAKAALVALKDAHAKETADHRAALGEMKAQYKSAEKAERDAIAQLVLARNTIKQEVSALVEAIKGLV